MKRANIKFSWGSILLWLFVVFLCFSALVLKFVLPGYSFSALVCMCVVGVILFYRLTKLLRKRFPKTMKVLRLVFTVCLCVGLLLAAITEAFIINASLGDPEERCDYVVVLGAKVRYDRPSVALMDRINTAYAYLEAHPDVIAVVSGGQGSDEPMSEARCIYEHLVARGIDPGRIWLEEKSASTWANLNYTLDLIEAKTGIRPKKLGVISSEYHMLRSGMMAQDCGVEPVRIPAKTSIFSQRVNHFLREVAGVWFYIVIGGHYD